MEIKGRLKLAKLESLEISDNLCSIEELKNEPAF